MLKNGLTVMSDILIFHYCLHFSKRNSAKMPERTIREYVLLESIVDNWKIHVYLILHPKTRCHLVE